MNTIIISKNVLTLLFWMSSAAAMVFVKQGKPTKTVPEIVRIVMMTTSVPKIAMIITSKNVSMRLLSLAAAMECEMKGLKHTQIVRQIARIVMIITALLPIVLITKLRNVNMLLPTISLMILKAVFDFGTFGL